MNELAIRHSIDDILSYTTVDADSIYNLVQKEAINRAIEELQKVRLYLNNEYKRFGDVEESIRKGESFASLEYTGACMITLDVTAQEIDQAIILLQGKNDSLWPN